MTIQDLYNEIGGNYDDVYNRLRMPMMIERFALRFLDDGSYKALSDHLEAGNVSEAFRAAHTLKGVCANLSFAKLLSSSSAITEMLRSGDIEEAKSFFPSVKRDYELTFSALENFKMTRNG